MKKIILIITLSSFSLLAFSQETKTLSNNDRSESASKSGYGGPLIEVPYINNDWGVMIGGKGGFVFNRKIGFGGIGKALIGNNNFVGDNLNGNENASLGLSYGVGGVFVEYILKLDSPVHFSIPVNFMAGGISIEDATSDDPEIESTGIFVIEPGINLEFNISQNFTPALNLSYRQVFGSSLVIIENQDLSGISFGLILKFGAY